MSNMCTLYLIYRFFLSSVHIFIITSLLPTLRNERLLKGLEKRHGVKKRWAMTSSALTSARARLDKRNRKKHLLKMRQLAVERVFLLEMKRKYAGVQPRGRRSTMYPF